MEQVACSHGAIFRKFELSALFVVAGVSLMACNSDVAAVVLPARFLANSLQCDASNLFLFGSSSDEYQKGDPILPSQEAVRSVVSDFDSNGRKNGLQARFIRQLLRLSSILGVVLFPIGLRC